MPHEAIFQLGKTKTPITQLSSEQKPGIVLMVIGSDYCSPALCRMHARQLAQECRESSPDYNHSFIGEKTEELRDLPKVTQQLSDRGNSQTSPFKPQPPPAQLLCPNTDGLKDGPPIRSGAAEEGDEAPGRAAGWDESPILASEILFAGERSSRGL